MFIYGLIDPRTDEIRYVGKANNLEQRFQSHQYDKSSTRKARWIRSLAKKELTPKIMPLESTDKENWEEAEQWWIAYFRQMNCDLLNHTDGGEGLKNPSKETREKISEIRKATFQVPEYRAWFDKWVQSPERRKKISVSNKGKKKASDHVAKLPQNRAGRKFSFEHREKIRISLLGNQRRLGQFPTSETRAKIRDSLKGNQHTKGRIMPEYEKRQRSEALLGRPKSEQQRENMRLAALKRWARQKGDL
jgi:hypothetical protein